MAHRGATWCDLVCVGKVCDLLVGRTGSMQRTVPRRRSRQSAASACLCRPPLRSCGGWHEQPPQLYRGGGARDAGCGHAWCLCVDGIGSVLLNAVFIARARHHACPHPSELVASRTVCWRSPAGRVEDRGDGGPALRTLCERSERLVRSATVSACVEAGRACRGTDGWFCWELCWSIRGWRSSVGRRRHWLCLRGVAARNHALDPDVGFWVGDR